MNKKAMNIEGIVNVIIFLGIGLIILFLLLSSITPTMYDRAEKLNATTTGADNATMLIGTASDLNDGNCIDGTMTCYNFSSGSTTDTLSSGNFTLTASTCSVTLATGSAFNNTNIQCNYTFRTSDQQEQYEGYGNLSGGLISLSEETSNIVPIAFAMIALIILFIGYGFYKKYAE
jgi:hypothetical protein